MTRNLSKSCCVLQEVSLEDEIMMNPWVNLFVGNQVKINRMEFNYIPPELVNGRPIVNIKKDEQEHGKTKWRHSLVLYVIGEMPGYNSIKW